MSLQEELGNLRHDFEAKRAAFQQLESGDLAQSIRQELQVGTLLVSVDLYVCLSVPSCVFESVSVCALVCIFIHAYRHVCACAYIVVNVYCVNVLQHL